MEAANLIAAPPDRSLAGGRERRAFGLAVTDTTKVTIGLFALTAAGAALGRAWPATAGATAPHPALDRTPEAIAGILQTNLRVLALPFILAIFRFSTSRPTRRLGDGLVLGALGANAVHVGVELGRWQGRLIAYLPHLPLEYLAAATAATVWIDARRRRTAEPWATVVYAVCTLLLLAVAAVVEVLLTPHAHR